jgi:Ca2+-binding RTX toxin-like protein
MATTYQFETITAAQAQAISQFDTVTFNGSANTASVTYGVSTYDVTVGVTSVTFGTFLPAVSAAGHLQFSDGSKLFVGDNTDNSVSYGTGDDAMFGGDGADTLNAGDGANLLQGNAGADSLVAAGGNDTIYGGKGDDQVAAGNGLNVVQGNIGADTIAGGSGADTLRGGQDNDSIAGGASEDWLSGDRGNDTLTGGGGADTFHSFSDAGVDRITDFQVSQGDHILLDAGTTYTTSQVGSDTVIDMGGGNQVILVGVSMSTLVSSSIVVG